MLRFRTPQPATIRRFLEAQDKPDLSYEAVGATASEPPDGYVVDHTRIEIGSGSYAFSTAKSALESWQQFRLGWLGAWPATTPISEGEVVAVVARSLGMWWLHACRIVYVIDEEEPKRFGFAYGTLPDHAGSGEERFLIEMDEEKTVWYDILAFSKPNQPLARIGYPLVRRAQRRFGQQSAEEMQRIVQLELKEAS